MTNLSKTQTQTQTQPKAANNCTRPPHFPPHCRCPA